MGKKGKGKKGRAELPFQLALGRAFSNAGAVVSGGHLRFGPRFVEVIRQVRKLDV